MAWLHLALAIAAEVAGTVALRGVARSEQRLVPLALVTLAYAASFLFMALALRHLGVGTVYAIWSGVGTAAVAVLGQALFGERLTWPAAVGMVLVVGGVVLLVTAGSAHAPATAAGSAGTGPAASQ